MMYWDLFVCVFAWGMGIITSYIEIAMYHIISFHIVCSIWLMDMYVNVKSRERTPEKSHRANDQVKFAHTAMPNHFKMQQLSSLAIVNLLAWIGSEWIVEWSAASP